MATYNYPANACPAPQITGILLSPAAGINANGQPAFYNGETVAGLTVDNLNRYALTGQNAFAAGGSPLSRILTGLTLTTSGLSVTAAPGQAMIASPVELTVPTPSGNSLTANAPNYIWLNQSGLVKVQPNSTAAPSGGPAVFLGRINTNATAMVGDIDLSGVLNKDAIPTRITSDAGVPNDVPPAGCPLFFTQTVSGLYLWSDRQQAYQLFAQTAATGSTTVTITANWTQVKGMRRVKVDCTAGNIVVTALPGSVGFNGTASPNLTETCMYERIDTTSNTFAIQGGNNTDSIVYNNAAIATGNGTTPAKATFSNDNRRLETEAMATGVRVLQPFTASGGSPTVTGG